MIMMTRHLSCLAVTLFTFAVTAVHAETLPDGPTAAPTVADRIPVQRPQGVDQMLYKGVVGNMLEAVPMDAEQRTKLQRANAVVSGTLTGRSLSMLAKLAHPGFLVGGLVWGLWAAANIDAAPPAAPAQDTATTASSVTQVADVTDTALPAITPSPIAQASASSVTEFRPRVVRIWLPPSAY